MKVSQPASCSSVTHSLGWCACSMWPGPQITVGIDARWNSDASVPNDTLPAPAAQQSSWPRSAIAEPSCVSKPGIVDRASNAMWASAATARIAGTNVCA